MIRFHYTPVLEICRVKWCLTNYCLMNWVCFRWLEVGCFLRNSDLVNFGNHTATNIFTRTLCEKNVKWLDLSRDVFTLRLSQPLKPFYTFNQTKFWFRSSKQVSLFKGLLLHLMIGKLCTSFSLGSEWVCFCSSIELFFRSLCSSAVVIWTMSYYRMINMSM